MFLNKNKKLIIGLLITTLFFGVSSFAKAITIADIELLITIGFISPENAEAARNYVNSQDVSKTPAKIVSSSQNSNSGCLVISQNVVKGKSGTLVSALQKFLKSRGHFPSTEAISGYYGDITVKAVTDFQIATGLIKTSTEAGAGTVGPITRAKIQEVSCVDAAASNPQNSATTTSNIATGTTTQTIFGDMAKVNTIKTVKPPKVIADYYERFRDEEEGRMIVRFDAVGTPKDLPSYLEGVLLCNPTVLKLTSSSFKNCGETFEVNPIKNGKKSFGITFDNSSRYAQSVTFAIEMFNNLKESIGSDQVDLEIPGKKPKIKLEINNQSTTQSVSLPLGGKICSFSEQLDFLRYTMTPSNSQLNVSLPTCWPGEILCNKSNPPTFCRIVDGPDSDDLCPVSQRFIEGKCIPRQ